MLGIRSDQYGQSEAAQLYLNSVGRDPFDGSLVNQRGQLFRDEDSAACYVLDDGCPSVSPSLLTTVLLLQTNDCGSDEDARRRADIDLLRNVALGIGLDEPSFAKSTPRIFRDQRFLHKEPRVFLKKGLHFARQSGCLVHYTHPTREGVDPGFCVKSTVYPDDNVVCLLEDYCSETLCRH